MSCERVSHAAAPPWAGLGLAHLHDALQGPFISCIVPWLVSVRRLLSLLKISTR